MSIFSVVGEDHEEDINVDDLQLQLQPEEARSSGGGGGGASGNGSAIAAGGGLNNLSRPNLTGGTHSLESVFGCVSQSIDQNYQSCLHQSV